MYEEGQTATNPKTGQQVIFRNGQWVNNGTTAQADTGVMSPQARIELQASGIPVLRQEADPFSRMTDPKQREMARRTAFTSGDKTLQADSDTVAASRSNLALAREFEELNSRGITGGLSGWLNSNLPSFLQGAGPGTQDEVQRMSMLTSKLAPQNRLAGTGAVSDFDAKQFLKMTGGLDKNPEVNARYIQAARMGDQAVIDRQAFREAFLSANGTLTGADRMWQEYASAEPIFDKKGNIRAGRRSWSDYFASRAQAALQPKKAAPAPAGIPLSQTRMPGGGKPAPKAKAAARVVDFNSLPE